MKEYLEISKYKIDYHSSRPVIPTHERPTGHGKNISRYIIRNKIWKQY